MTLAHVPRKRQWLFTNYENYNIYQYNVYKVYDESLEHHILPTKIPLYFTENHPFSKKKRKRMDKTDSQFKSLKS